MIWLYRALVFITAATLAVYCKEHNHTFLYVCMTISMVVSLFTGPMTLTN